jgi:hypothetical protein
VALDRGRYCGSIREYGVTQSQAGQQHPTVFITFELIGRYNPTTGELEACPAISRSYFKAITPKTIGWLLADLKAIGYDRPSLEYLDPETPGAANLFDVEIEVDCEHETYEGQVRERWSIHREQRRERIRRDALARLDMQYADQIKRVLGSAQGALPPPAMAETNNEDPI